MKTKYNRNDYVGYSYGDRVCVGWTSGKDGQLAVMECRCGRRQTVRPSHFHQSKSCKSCSMKASYAARTATLAAANDVLAERSAVAARPKGRLDSIPGDIRANLKTLKLLQEIQGQQFRLALLEAYYVLQLPQDCEINFDTGSITYKKEPDLVRSP
jgi:hypothetical protein